MAFLSKVGNVVRQTVSRQLNSELGFTPSIYQSIRCMSSSPSSKLFIGGLSFSTDEPSLRQEFAKYGEIVDARIIHDRETGRSRGFGFVTFTNVEEASSAIQALDGKELHGRLVRVNYANEKPRTFGGGYNNAQYGSGGGGFGGGGYGGAGGGSSFSGGYGNAPYSGAGGGGYNPSNYEGPAAGGNYASGVDYNTNNYGGNSYGIGSAGGSYGGSDTGYGNDGSFGVAGGVGGSDSLGNAGGFGGSDNFRNDRSTSVGYDASGEVAGSNFATGGYDGNNGTAYGSNLNHAGDDANSLKGTYGEDDNENNDFANRA